MRVSLLTIVAASFVLPIFACGGEASFKGSSGASAPEASPEPDDPPQQNSGDVVEKPAVVQRTTQEKEFELSTTNKVDIMWVIDNSGSMSNEAASVQQNIGRFMSFVGSKADARLLVLSSATNNGVTLPANASGHVQVPVTVESTDGALLVAAAICPAEQTDTTTRVLCGQTNILRPGVSNGRINQTKGTFVPHLRKGSKKIMVFVTDDDASMVDESNFLSLVTGSLDGAPRVFGFVGTSSPSCSICRRGEAYEALAQATGGGTFDICATDWSANFDALTNKVVQIAQSDFTLPGAAGDVVVESVMQDTRVLGPAEWSVQGNVLSINPDAIDPSGGRIRVRYSVTTQLALR